MDFVIELLNDLAEFEDKREKLAAPLQKMIKELQYDQDVLTAYLDERIKLTRADIASQVLTHRSTFKGKAKWAVYNRGRTSWDNKGLAGYGVAHPGILVFRKQGTPYVSIRTAPKAKSLRD